MYVCNSVRHESREGSSSSPMITHFTGIITEGGDKWWLTPWYRYHTKYQWYLILADLHGTWLVSGTPPYLSPVSAPGYLVPVTGSTMGPFTGSRYQVSGTGYHVSIETGSSKAAQDHNLRAGLNNSADIFNEWINDWLFFYFLSITPTPAAIYFLPCHSTNPRRHLDIATTNLYESLKNQANSDRRNVYTFWKRIHVRDDVFDYSSSTGILSSGCGGMERNNWWVSSQHWDESGCHDIRGDHPDCGWHYGQQGQIPVLHWDLRH